MIGVLLPPATRGSTITDAEDNVLIQFDANIAERHAFEGKVTDHPSGATSIDDNQQLMGDRLQITGLVTNTPIDPFAIELANLGQLPANRVQSEFDVLLAILNSKTRITVITSIRVYENVLIESITLDRNRPTADIEPVVNMKQVRIANTQEVPIPARILAANVRLRGQKNSDLGQQSKKNATDAEKNEFDLNKKTLAKGLKDGDNVLGFVGKSLGLTQ